MKPEELVESVTSLLRLNRYEVEGPIQLHGAEIDLVAKSLTDPVGSPIYLELTVEYVDNDKYGRDIGKLAMIARLEPEARKIIVSSRGFSLPVQERAKATGILTHTYSSLFALFERFDSYIKAATEKGRLAEELENLSSRYEEPVFDDPMGHDSATGYLSTWRDQNDPKSRWLIVSGEYGTGKTALTKILLLRWLRDYKQNPDKPLALRIELRDFHRQFDARGLLHHFLDNNSLSHVSVEFLEHLIRSGRVVLLLDGYDEMAQYLQLRERRTCLQALAELSAGGAKGILTSRPNFFTEAEELLVFETLYSALERGQFYLGRRERELIAREQRVDEMLERFLERRERRLRDLTPEQTESLVRRSLANDPEGQELVLSLLRKIFRTTESGDAISLSGKPVIVTYLLDLVEELKSDSSSLPGALSEWTVYRLIVDRLMLRDLERAEVGPVDRRRFLHRLGVFLSKKEHNAISEADFKDLVSREFKTDLARVGADARHIQIERYFVDLRTSATLTSADGHGGAAWRFSHNSLREYLLCELLAELAKAGEVLLDEIPISDAMKSFVASMPQAELGDAINSVGLLWPRHLDVSARGQYLELFLDAARLAHSSAEDPSGEAIRAMAGRPPQLRRATIYLTHLDWACHAGARPAPAARCGRGVVAVERA